MLTAAAGSRGYHAMKVSVKKGELLKDTMGGLNFMVCVNSFLSLFSLSVSKNCCSLPQDTHIHLTTDTQIHNKLLSHIVSKENVSFPPTSTISFSLLTQVEIPLFFFPQASVDSFRVGKDLSDTIRGWGRGDVRCKDDKRMGSD